MTMMATEVKKGDRVRVTFEGEVKRGRVTGDLDIAVGGATYYVRSKEGVTVEVLERAAKFGPGTVVAEAEIGSGFATLVKVGEQWVHASGRGATTLTDDEIERQVGLGERVVRYAPA